MKTIIQKRNVKKISALVMLITLIGVFLIPLIWTTPPDGRGHIKISKNSVSYFETIDALTGLFTQAIWTYNGTFVGHHYPLDTEIVSVTMWFANSKVKVKFSGIWNETKKGTFKAIIAGQSNPSLGYPNQFKSKFEIIPGSGTGDLVGICGYGTMKGEERDFKETSTGSYEFHFHFNEECN